MAKKRFNGYYPRSKGIKEYIHVYSDAAWKLHDYFLMEAEWKNTRNYGRYTFVLSQLAKRLNKHPQTIKRCIRELHFGYTIQSKNYAPPFIKVLKVSGKTNSQTITIKVLKPKLKPSDFKKKGGNSKPDSLKTPSNANPETVKYYEKMAKRFRDERKLPEPKGAE